MQGNHTPFVSPEQVLKDRSTTTLPEEVWKDIPGYGGVYQASSLGRIRSDYRTRTIDGWHIKALVVSQNGYLMVALYCDAKQQTCYVHRLVGAAFLPPERDKPEINHRNGNRIDNRVTNLEWVTRTENQRHSWAELNRPPSVHLGKENPGAKITEGDAQQIRGLRAEGYKLREIGDMFGLNFSTVSDICRRKTWRHVP